MKRIDRRGMLAGMAIAGWLAGGGLPAMAQEPLLVFAAASLGEAMTAAAAAFETETGVPVSVSFAGSGALARQLDQGAPADVFISADRAWMDYAVEQDLVRPGSLRALFSNTLVMVAPADPAPEALDLAADGAVAAALGDGRLAMGAPDVVPAGTYARQALTSLGHWDAVADRVAAVENVRVALALVARGEAPLGIVYGSDAAADPEVAVVATFPAESHLPIVYPAAVTTASDHRHAAAFLDWLASPAGRAIAVPLGFEPAPGDG